MAIESEVTMDQLVRAVTTEAVREAGAQRLWVRRRPELTEFWLLTAPLDSADEPRLYEITPRLYERFPAARFELHPLNPRHFATTDPDQLLPQGAEEIALRPRAK